MKDTSAHNVFSTAEAKAHKGYQTMDALLLNIDQQFEQMRFHIEAEVRERSIAEQLRGVSNTGKTLVSRLFQLMTYVLSPDDSVPPFFGINAFYQTIKRPDVIRYVRNSVHGRLMAEIASGPDVQVHAVPPPPPPTHTPTHLPFTPNPVVGPPTAPIHAPGGGGGSRRSLEGRGGGGGWGMDTSDRTHVHRAGGTSLGFITLFSV